MDPSSSHYDHTPAKHTHIALKSTCWFILSCALLLSHLPSHRLSQLFSISILFLFSQLGLEPSQGTAHLLISQPQKLCVSNFLFHRGVVAGLQGVKSGISLIGDKVQSSLSKSGEAFPDTPEGHCITAVCSSIRYVSSPPSSLFLLQRSLVLLADSLWRSLSPFD